MKDYNQILNPPRICIYKLVDRYIPIRLTTRFDYNNYKYKSVMMSTEKADEVFGKYLNYVSPNNTIIVPKIEEPETEDDFTIRFNSPEDDIYYSRYYSMLISKSRLVNRNLLLYLARNDTKKVEEYTKLLEKLSELTLDTLEDLNKIKVPRICNLCLSELDDQGTCTNESCIKHSLKMKLDNLPKLSDIPVPLSDNKSINTYIYPEEL